MNTLCVRPRIAGVRVAFCVVEFTKKTTWRILVRPIQVLRLILSTDSQFFVKAFYRPMEGKTEVIHLSFHLDSIS